MARSSDGIINALTMTPQKKSSGQKKYDGGTLFLVENDRIISWSHKDRSEEELADDPSFLDLVENIKLKGRNIQAIKVRPIPKEQRKERNIPDHVLYEQIWGFKRLQACKAAGKPVMCLIEEMDDAEAYSEMLAENKGRSPLSAWTKAESWYATVSSGLMTAEEISVQERIKLESVEAYLRVVEIADPEITSSVKMHKFGWEALYELRSALLKFKDDSKRYSEYVDRVIESADVIDSGRATKKFMINLAERVAADGGTVSSPTQHVMAGKKKLVSMKKTKRGYSVTFHKAAADALGIEDFESVMKDLLKERGLKVD